MEIIPVSSMKRKTKRTQKKIKSKKRGGALCKPPYDIDIPENDIYTIDRELETHEHTDNPINIFTDEQHPNVIIKQVKNPHEYKMLKLLEHTGFTPKLYGFYKCNGDRAKLKSFQKDSTMYIVMEKMDGPDLLELIRGEEARERERAIKEVRPIQNVSGPIVDMYIDQIYKLYNILMDKGFIHTDLFLQNIILSRGRIYFIDFEYVDNTQQSIPLVDRMSLEQLRGTLITGRRLQKK
jgi:serine/threonine protein kinase